MKKENRELAKQRREKERKKKKTLHLVKKIVLGVIIGGVSYYLIARIFKMKELEQLVSLVKGYIGKKA